METSNKSTGQLFSDPTSFAEDTPASHSAQRAKGKGKKTRDTCGHGCEKQLAIYDPTTQSWKMSEVTSALVEPPLWETLPPSGMTVDGIAYQLPPSAPRSSAIGYSLSLGHNGPNSHGLWPTATTQDHATRYSQGGMPLGMAVRLYWTPTATANYAAPSMVQRGGHAGYLNPTWVEWLMGFPIGWTDCED